MMHKLKQRKGLTLTELLVSVLLISIMTIGVIAGTNAALNTYRKSVGLSRVQGALSTLMEAVGDELRLADKVNVTAGVVTYASARKSANQVQLDINANGELVVDNDLLVGSGIYSDGEIEVTAFTLAYADHVFQVDMTVTGVDSIQASATCRFRCLNDQITPP